MNTERDIEAWIEGLPAGVGRIRVRVGPPRGLRKVAEVELDDDGTRRGADELAREVEAALDDAGFPDDGAESYCLDALNDRGVGVRTLTETQGGARRSSPRELPGNESDVGRLLTAFIEKDRIMGRALRDLSIGYAHLLQRTREGVDDVAAERAARLDAEAAAELMAHGAELAEVNGEASLKERGISALESLLDKVAGPRRFTAAELRELVKAHPELVRELASDPEVAATIAAALAGQSSS